MNADLLIRGGTVVDGSGAPRYSADVAVDGDRIVAVGELPDAHAATVIDAAGKLVSPGFIDAHPHSETALRGNGDLRGAFLQGVTTHLTAPDGFGWAPLPDGRSTELWRSTAFAYGQPDLAPDWRTIDAYLDGFAGVAAINVVPMVPHQAVRFAVLGWDPRRPNASELDEMRDIVREWMETGAFGLNTGLDYQPAASSTTDELVELAKVVAEYGGVYAAHMRYNELGKPAAYRESIEIGRRARVPVRLSHEFVDDETANLLDEAVAAEVDLGIDWYLYPAGSSHLLVWLPPKDQVGGYEQTVRRLRTDAAYRARVSSAIEKKVTEYRLTGGGEYFADTRSGRYIGMSLPEVAAERGQPVGLAAVDLIIEESPDAVMVFRRGISPEDFRIQVRESLAHPAFTVASDGIYHGALPHPRGYGCYAQVLGTYVREQRFVSLERAIHLMSGLPAARFGIADRGLIAIDMAADLVVFDAATVGSRATWKEPRATAAGVSVVIVNGQLVAQDGEATGAKPGRVVRSHGRW